MDNCIQYMRLENLDFLISIYMYAQRGTSDTQYPKKFADFCE